MEFIQLSPEAEGVEGVVPVHAARGRGIGGRGGLTSTQRTLLTSSSHLIQLKGVPHETLQFSGLYE